MCSVLVYTTGYFLILPMTNWQRIISFPIVHDDLFVLLQTPCAVNRKTDVCRDTKVT